jgi:hypothetical protein
VLPTPILYVHLLYIGNINQEKEKKKEEKGKLIFSLSLPAFSGKA